MPGTQLPVGIDTVNPVDADFKKGPWPSLAAAKAGILQALRYNHLTVYITGDPNVYEWLDTDLSNTGLVIKAGGSSSLTIQDEGVALPQRTVIDIVGTGISATDNGSKITITVPAAPAAAIAKGRYVYLYQDATDVAALGGATNRVYNTFQAAYDAADALQVSLGGANIVVIMVGNISAAVAGNLVLTTNYNQYVYIIGNSKTNSILGNISSTIAGVGMPNNFVIEKIRMSSINFNNAAVYIDGGGDFYISSIYTAGGKASILQCSYAQVNVINTSGISGVASGQVIAVLNVVFECTAIQMDSVAASVGSCSINSNNYVSINFVQMSITGSTTGTETIGAFQMRSNLYASLPNGITQNTNHLSPVATWGGIQISNLGRTSVGAISINYNSTAGSPASDLLIANFTLQRVDGFEVGINWQINTLSTPKGGSVTNFSLIESSFSYRVRVGYRPTTARANARFNLDGANFSSNLVSRGFIFYHSLHTFSQLQIINSLTESLDIGIVINNINTTSIQMSLTNRFLIRNNRLKALTVISRNAGTTSIIDDVVLINNTIDNLTLEVAQGDMNFSIDQCTSKNTKFIASGSATSIRRNIITNSDLDTTVGSVTLQGAAPRPKLSLRNSYLNIYTTNVSAGTIDIEAYSSFINTIADTGSVSTYIGSVYSSTVKRLTTDNVAGLTFNASFDQPV